ncbi:unnamed protein product, partial [Polarella glacialis]
MHGFREELSPGYARVRGSESPSDFEVPLERHAPLAQWLHGRQVIRSTSEGEPTPWWLDSQTSDPGASRSFPYGSKSLQEDYRKQKDDTGVELSPDRSLPSARFWSKGIAPDEEFNLKESDAKFEEFQTSPLREDDARPLLEFARTVGSGFDDLQREALARQCHPRSMPIHWDRHDSITSPSNWKAQHDIHGRTRDGLSTALVDGNETEVMLLEHDCYSLAAVASVPWFWAFLAPLSSATVQLSVLYFLAYSNENIFDEGKWLQPLSTHMSLNLMKLVSTFVSLFK